MSNKHTIHEFKYNINKLSSDILYIILYYIEPNRNFILINYDFNKCKKKYLKSKYSIVCKTWNNILSNYLICKMCNTGKYHCYLYKCNNCGHILTNLKFKNIPNNTNDYHQNIDNKFYNLFDYIPKQIVYNIFYYITCFINNYNEYKTYILNNQDYTYTGYKINPKKKKIVILHNIGRNNKPLCEKIKKQFFYKKYQLNVIINNVIKN